MSELFDIPETPNENSTRTPEGSDGRRTTILNTKTTMKNQDTQYKAERADIPCDSLFAAVAPIHSAILKAIEWRSNHAAHVQMLEDEASCCLVPCDEDLNHPELWKPGSWLWLRTFFSANGKDHSHE